jgi:hypothetical protein
LPHCQNNGEDGVPDFFVSTVGIADGFQRPRFWQLLIPLFNPKPWQYFFARLQTKQFFPNSVS